MRKVAVYCGTRNLYEDMLTAAKSLIINTNVDQVYFLIEDDEFPFEIPDSRIKCINVANQTYFKEEGPNYKSKWTYMVLMRAALSKVLPNEDVVLSLDVDTIVDKDISELWDLNINHYYIAAAREPYKSSGSRVYINMGVALLNLKRWRERKLDDEIISCLNRYYYAANEQDCINDKCQSRILEISPNYNVCDFTTLKIVSERKIIHYAGIANWNNKDLVQDYRAKEWPQQVNKKEEEAPAPAPKKRGRPKKHA